MSTATQPALCPDTYVRNLRALWQVDPALALRVEAVDDEQRLPLEPTRSGHWTAQAPTPAGAPIYLHSRYDPVADAERFVARIPLEDKYCFVVQGFGLGYHVQALFDRLRGDAFIVCLEPSLAGLATALACVDCSALIASGKLIVLVDTDKARLHDRLGQRNTLMMLGAQFVTFPPALKTHPAEQQALHGLISEFAVFSRMSLMTLVQNAQITCRNIAMNLPTYVATPGIDQLRGQFAGVPGIVISAGPSLRHVLDQLAGAHGHAVLIAVQTALRPLLQRGIVPDFATSLDFHEMSTKFYEGLAGLEQVHLIAEPKAHWHVIDRYPGPVSLLRSEWATQLLGPELGERAGLRAGATVAHLAFYLAVHLGCDPIIFVGQDLAFTGHVFYVPGVEIHHAWRSELNRFQTMEMKEWERIARNREILHQVPGAAGGQVYTDELLLTYLEQFEKDIAAVPQRVINATGGGAALRGTEALPLADALARYAAGPIDPQRFAYREATPWRDPSRCAAALREVRARQRELDDTIALCEEMLDLLAQLKGLVDDPERFNRRLVRVDELREKVQWTTRPFRIINSATQLAELRRYSADRKLQTAEDDDAERARRQLDRDVEFVSAVRDGARTVREMLDQAGTRLEEAQA